MKNIRIHLNTFDKIKRYIGIVEKLECEIDLVSERYIVDGKSILGILSLDLSDPVEIRIMNHQPEQGLYPKELEEFII